MHDSFSDSIFVPEWQSQLHLSTYSTTRNRQIFQDSSTMASNRNSLLGSFKAKLSRKNSNRSTASRESAEEASSPISPSPINRTPSPSFRGPVELSAEALNLTVPSQQRDRSPLLNPSSPTRRPGKFPFLACHEARHM